MQENDFHFELKFEFSKFDRDWSISEKFALMRKIGSKMFWTFLICLFLFLNVTSSFSQPGEVYILIHMIEISSVSSCELIHQQQIELLIPYQQHKTG